MQFLSFFLSISDKFGIPTIYFYLYNLFLVMYGRCVYILMLDNFCLKILQSDYFYNFCNLNNHIDSYQWWMYLRDQLQIVHVFGFLLEFAWKPHFNLSLDWFSWYVSSFFFKFWYFELRFDYIFINCNIFCYNIIINFYYLYQKLLYLLILIIFLYFWLIYYFL